MATPTHNVADNHGVTQEPSHQEPARAPSGTRRTLARGVLVFRWVALLWMSVLALTHPAGFERPGLAWGSIAAAAAWTVWLTAGAPRWGWTLWADLALGAWLLVASGLVVADGAVVAGRPLFATGYPLSPVLLWAVTRGPGAGLGAAAAMSIAAVLARGVNGTGLTEIPAEGLQNLAGAAVNFLVAGGAVGIVSRLVVRSAEELQQTHAELLVERERAARLAERESLAREIHDSVLQSLALVHKKGQEIARRGQGGSERIRPDEVRGLADLAGEQEAGLRDLILREPEPSPEGTASLRETLEKVARSVNGLRPTVSSVGPIHLEKRTVTEIAAATREGLTNVVKHANATSASVFIDETEENVTVSLRDDGVGFDYDEDALRARGKAGMLGSMKGRVNDLGGAMTVTSQPGHGTEIELRVPKSQAST